jgi:hypothetical protein
MNIEKLGKITIKSLLFFNSYIVLWILLGIKYHSVMGIVGVSVLIEIIIISHLALCEVIRYKKSKSPDRVVTVSSCENLTSINLEYLITYIIPFVQVNTTNYADIFAIIVLYIFVWWLYVSSDLIYINPILKAKGYNLFKVIDGASRREYIIITKKEKILIDDEIVGHSFYNDDIILMGD